MQPPPVVKLLIKAVIEHASSPSRAQDKWEGQLGEGELPGGRIWVPPHHPALTPRDKKASLRILHRSIKMYCTLGDKPATCRLCHKGRVTLFHLAECEIVSDTFETMLLADEGKSIHPKNGVLRYPLPL